MTHSHVYLNTHITGADPENFSKGGPTLSEKNPLHTQKLLITSYLIVILWIDSV